MPGATSSPGMKHRVMPGVALVTDFGDRGVREQVASHTLIEEGVSFRHHSNLLHVRLGVQVAYR